MAGGGCPDPGLEAGGPGPDGQRDPCLGQPRLPHAHRWRRSPAGPRHARRPPSRAGRGAPGLKVAAGALLIVALAAACSGSAPTARSTSSPRATPSSPPPTPTPAPTPTPLVPQREEDSMPLPRQEVASGTLADQAL